jgi:hypothetical protein
VIAELAWRFWLGNGMDIPANLHHGYRVSVSMYVVIDDPDLPRRPWRKRERGCPRATSAKLAQSRGAWAGIMHTAHSGPLPSKNAALELTGLP